MVVVTAPASAGVVIVVVVVVAFVLAAERAVEDVGGAFGGVGVLGGVAKLKAAISSATSSSKGEPSTLHFHS